MEQENTLLQSTIKHKDQVISLLRKDVMGTTSKTTSSANENKNPLVNPETVAEAVENVQVMTVEVTSRS